jgi:hypothetical protein
VLTSRHSLPPCEQHIVLELARAPIPVNWEPIDEDDDSPQAHGGAKAPPRSPRSSLLQRYLHLHTGQTVLGHPAASQVRRAAEGLKARSERKTGSYKARGARIGPTAAAAAAPLLAAAAAALPLRWQRHAD